MFFSVDGESTVYPVRLPSYLWPRSHVIIENPNTWHNNQENLSVDKTQKITVIPLGTRGKTGSPVSRTASGSSGVQVPKQGWWKAVNFILEKDRGEVQVIQFVVSPEALPAIQDVFKKPKFADAFRMVGGKKVEFVAAD